jgi:hypothetical protein
MEFKVSDKVEATHNILFTDKYCYKEGWKGRITGFDGSGLNIQFDNGKHITGCSVQCFKLVQEEDQKMDYREALKLAIDGYKVRNSWMKKYNDKYLCFDKNTMEFRMHDHILFIPGINDYKSDWEVVLSQPKFALNQFVSISSGNIAKIVEIKQEKFEHIYMLQFNAKQPSILCKYKEDELTAV